MAYRRFNQTFHHGLNAVLLLALLMPKLGLADTLIGEVVAVTDGDSITVVTEGVQYKIRLTGIDAPERHQAYGLQSKQSLLSRLMSPAQIAQAQQRVANFEMTSS